MPAPRKPRPAPAPAAKKAAAPRAPRARKLAAVPTLPAGVPTPPRSLGDEGLKTWVRVWSLRKRWIQLDADLEHITVLCESVDERQALRAFVLVTPDAWRERVALRALDAQIVSLMGALGLNPTERARLGSEEEARGKLAALRSSREA